MGGAMRRMGYVKRITLLFLPISNNWSNLENVAGRAFRYQEIQKQIIINMQYICKFINYTAY